MSSSAPMENLLSSVHLSNHSVAYHLQTFKFIVRKQGEFKYEIKVKSKNIQRHFTQVKVPSVWLMQCSEQLKNLWNLSSSMMSRLVWWQSFCFLTAEVFKCPNANEALECYCSDFWGLLTLYLVWTATMCSQVLSYSAYDCHCDTGFHDMLNSTRVFIGS